MTNNDEQPITDPHFFSREADQYMKRRLFLLQRLSEEP